MLVQFHRNVSVIQRHKCMIHLSCLEKKARHLLLLIYYLKPRSSNKADSKRGDYLLPRVHGRSFLLIVNQFSSVQLTQYRFFLFLIALYYKEHNEASLIQLVHPWTPSYNGPTTLTFQLLCHLQLVVSQEVGNIWLILNF